MTRQRWVFIGGMLVAVMVGVLLLAYLLAEPLPVRIQATTARGLTPDYLPLEPTGTFAPEDVFYLSVRVERAPSASVVAVRWRYAGTVITLDEQQVGPAVVDYTVGFELRRVDQLWPVGNYSADVLLNGELVGQVAFVVQGDA